MVRVRLPRDFFIYMMTLTKVKKPWIFAVPCSTYERQILGNGRRGNPYRPSCSFVELGESGTKASWFPSFQVSAGFSTWVTSGNQKKSISDGHIGTTAVLTNLNVEYDAVETGDTALNNCFFINTLMSLEDKLIFSEAEMLRILLVMDTYKDC